MAKLITDVSAAYTVRGSDEEVRVTTGSSTLAITLPLVANVRKFGTRIRVSKVDSGSGKARITPSGSDTIAGQTTFDVPYQHMAVELFPDAKNSVWRFIGVGTDIVMAPSVTPADSYQPIAADLTLGATSGSSDAGNTAFFAPVMGNLWGTNLSKTQNYLGGGIFHYSVDGTRASTYPAGAILAGIGDLSTGADGAVVAYLDGDSGVTSANAAFKVMNNNSTAASKFTYGVDLYSAAHDGFNAVAFANADIRLNNQAWVISGALATRAGVEAAFPTAPIGSRYHSTDAGRMYLKVADAGAATDWEKVTTSAAD